MGIFKRGKRYWYNFWWDGHHIQRSTRQGNPRVARQMEAAYRTQLAKGEVGLVKPAPVPTFADFAKNEFLPWVKATFADKAKTRAWYQNGIRRLEEFAPISSARLDQITGAMISAYVSERRAEGLAVSSVNRELQVLRRLLRLAVEWGRTPKAAMVRMLPGERRRERVLAPEEETRYLAAAPEPLRSVVTILLDEGLRPEECFRLRWEFVTLTNARYGRVLIPHGKTASARRMVPLTRRVHDIMEQLWIAARRPTKGWVFPAPTRSEHMEPSTVRRQHVRTLKAAGLAPFDLYTCRHTFLTRLGESGCDAWTLARIAGHSSIAISARYVHPSDDAVNQALGRMQTLEALPAPTPAA